MENRIFMCVCVCTIRPCLYVSICWCVVLSLHTSTRRPLTNRTIITTCLIKYACILCGIKQVHQPHPHQLHLFGVCCCCVIIIITFLHSFVKTAWMCGRHKIRTKLNIIVSHRDTKIFNALCPLICFVAY